MFRRTLLLFIVTPVLLLVVTGCGTPKAAPSPAVTSTLNAAEYQTSLHNLVDPLLRDHTLSGVREKILDLRVPPDYLAVHLQVVLALDMIEQGRQTQDQERVEQGFQKLEQLRHDNPWL